MNIGVGGIITTTILALVTLFFSRGWKGLNKFQRTGLIALMILTIVSGYFSCKKLEKENLIERINAKFFTISDKGTAEKIILQIGPKKGASMFELMNGHLNTTPNPISPNPIIWFRLKDKKLLVNGLVRDFEGKIIAAIEDNECTLFSDNYEYQNNDHAIELVTKGERKILFQLYLKNGLVIFQGLIMNDLGSGIYYYQNAEGVTIGMPFSKEEKINSFGYLSATPQRIFKYPRATYLGEMIEE